MSETEEDKFPSISNMARGFDMTPQTFSNRIRNGLLSVKQMESMFNEFFPYLIKVVDATMQRQDDESKDDICKLASMYAGSFEKVILKNKPYMLLHDDIINAGFKYDPVDQMFTKGEMTIVRDNRLRGYELTWSGNVECIVYSKGELKAEMTRLQKYRKYE